VIQYEVEDIKTREVITRIEETEAVETRSEKVVRIRIPDDALEGNYLLRATAYYQDLEATASFTFKIIEQEVAALEITEEEVTPFPKDSEEACNDFDVCTIDSFVDGQCAYEEIRPCCGDFICQEGENEDNCPDDCLKILGRGEAIAEIIRQAESLAEENLLKAAQLCRSIQDTYKADECLLNIARKSRKSVLCGQLLERRTKDKCFVDFAIKDEKFELCDKIYDRWLKQSCTSYARLSKIQPTLEERAEAANIEE